MSDNKSTKKIGILDYGCGNVRSIINAIRYLNFDYSLISNVEELKQVKTVIMPGVGAFDHAIESLAERNLDVAIKQWTEGKSNFLIGVCLGMQLLCTSSEESEKKIKGLDIIPSRVIDLRSISEEKIRVPHIGWNTVSIGRNAFLSKSEYDYYFVHSYGVFTDNAEHTIGTTNLGGAEFSSVISNNKNVIGFQFHPEKSHDNGLNLLKECLCNA